MTEQNLELREKRALLMETGEIKKTLLTLAIPSIVATLISAIYNLVDTMFVGMLNDTIAMSAVSVSFPLFMIISALGQMLGVGSASYISRCLGEKNKKQADKTASTAFFTAIILSILTCVIGLIFLSPTLTSMGATKAVLSAARDYSIPLLLGTIFTIINMTLNNIIRAEGNSKFSMNALIIGAVINIILDPIFIFTFKLGVAGAAIATVIGQALSTLYLLRYFFCNKSFVKISLKDFCPSKLIYAEIFKIGLPVFFMQFLSSIAFSIQNSAVAPYGETALAATGITLRIYIIPSYVVMGFIQGFQPFAGYNYGAKKYNRVNESLKLSTIWLTVFMFICFLIFQIGAETLVKVFSRDDYVIKLSINNLKAMSFLCPLTAFTMIYNALFQALGKGKQAALLALGRQGLFFIPLLLLLPKLFENHIDKLHLFTTLLPHKMPAGLYGVMYAQTAADLIAFVITLVLAINIKKELHSCNEISSEPCIEEY